VPIHSEDYVHRIGRTGRAGRSGKSLTLALPADEKHLAKIEELVKKAIPVAPSPLGADETFERRPERPRREKGERREPRPERVPPPRPSPEPKPAREAKRGERVPGMGDHVPAFLMRELRVGPPAVETAEAEPEGLDEPTAEAAPEKPKPRRKPRSRPAPEASAA
jgi:ATP-dependent RNA helicase RhlE